MSRIAARMQALASAGRKAVVPYIVAGDPWPEVTVPALHALVAAGADIIELGVPFSDPMAEGPAIQIGHERALQRHTSLRDVLAMVAEFRQGDANTPIVLMGYANPIEVMGADAFAAAAASAGVDGVLTVDLPPEEAEPLNKALKQHHIDCIFLIAPTTSETRAKQILDMATGYVYYVSLKGVTGAGHLDASAVAEQLAALKQQTSLPVCVGFGIKDADSARRVARSADGVVVGSVLVDAMGQCAGMANRDDGAFNRDLAAGERAKIAQDIHQRLGQILADIDAGANT